jgi:hypothetical protein
MRVASWYLCVCLSKRSLDVVLDRDHVVQLEPCSQALSYMLSVARNRLLTMAFTTNAVSVEGFTGAIGNTPLVSPPSALSRYQFMICIRYI